MLGAIIGDIVGSRFEWNNIKKKDFELFTNRSYVTDDSIMTLAVAQAILDGGDSDSISQNAVNRMRELGREYPNAGYGGAFSGWIDSRDPRPYNSYGNGAAMRVSPCCIAADQIDQAIELAHAVTRVTHDHPMGLLGAEATTVAIYMARTGSDISEIRSVIDSKYYSMNFTLDDIRPTYSFDVTCQGSVPQALAAFFESTGFEDAIRNAISIGGDSDTIAAITGSIAGEYYGIPDEISEKALEYLDERQLEILNAFESRYRVK